MCRFCDHVKDEIKRLQDRLGSMECKREHKRPIKHPGRRSYHKAYYQANRERKLAAANERHKNRKDHAANPCP
jgi:hypothetical protein